MIMNQSRRRIPALMTAALLLGVSAATLDAGAQNNAAERPRIGLVLGGGGARGAAHIGVLRELERLRVPIDAIAGTSMGALVGGLYASGMTAAELENMLSSIDWADAMADTPRRENLSFRRKEDDEQFPIKLELGIGTNGVEVPMGLIQGQRLDLLLRELTIHVSHIDDFDHLPIPFRAVATDIETAEPYVMGEGDLALAMRASMSVPGAFAPTSIAEHLLVDGGLVDNLPIGIAREMGVDIVIAVDVEFPLYARDELVSGVKISEQMLTILIRKDTLRQIGKMNPEDILIQPKLGTFASSNFGEIADTVEPGAEATAAVSGQLQGLALDEEEYAAFLAGRVEHQRPDEPLDFVRVVHDGHLADNALQTRIHVKAGDPIDPKRIAADANRLYSLSLYEQVGYSLVEDEGGRGLEYRAQAKSWGTNNLLFGLSLEDDFQGSTAFNVTTRLTRVGINSRGAEWRTDLQLGTDPLAFTEFFQPLRAGSRWFIAPRLEIGKSNLNAFLMDDEIARLRISEAEAGLDFGWHLGNSSELRLGAYRGSGESNVKIGDPDIPNIDFDSGGFLARYQLDTRDNAYFPRHGIRADVKWNASREGLGADSDFDAVAADLTTTWTRGRSSFDIGLSYATTSDGTGAVQELFTLGGFQRLSGLERGSLSGPHAALARLVYRHRISDSAADALDAVVFLGASVEAGNVWQQRSDISFSSALINGSVFAGLDTLVGPIFLGAGFAEGGGANYYLFIGAPPR